MDDDHAFGIAGKIAGHGVLFLKLARGMTLLERES
jgi:hypothetical protein